MKKTWMKLRQFHYFTLIIFLIFFLILPSLLPTTYAV